MLVGCVLFLWWEKRRPEQYDEIGIAIASGMVAGEGLAGILQGVFGVLNVQPLTNAGCYGFPC